MPRLIDIHAHVNFNAFTNDADDVIKRTLDDNVWMILVGSQIDTSQRAVAYAEKYPHGVYAAVALHPIHLAESRFDPEELGASGDFEPGFTTRKEKFDDAAYRAIAQSDKVVAIGECGIDHYRVEGDDMKNIQEETFRRHIRLARELKKPIIVHCRDAYEDCFRVLKEERAGEVGGTMHCFVGTWSEAQKFLDLGFHLSFTGIVTFARQYDETLRNAPLDRMMAETDAPYLAPTPYRGKRNEPLYVQEVAKKIAEIRNISYDEVAEVTTRNAMQLFGLP